MPTSDDLANLQNTAAQFGTQLAALAADVTAEAQASAQQLAAAQSQVQAAQTQIAQLQTQLAAKISSTAFFDDFTAPTINTGRWNVRTDYQSNHLGYNTPANCTIQSDGLHITAKRQTGLPGQPTSKPYTTGYLDTIGKFSQATGRWEIVAKLPTFKGAWPALWLRCDTTAGEIDILEAVGGLPGTVVETVHQDTSGSGDKSGFECKPAGFNPAVWHTYALERDGDGSVRWYLDGTLTRSRTPADLDNQKQPMTWLAGPTFASPLNLRVNLQVGGTMPTYYGLNVDNTSVLPGDFVIRSVRITH